MRLKGNEPVCPHCGYDERTKNDIHQLPTGTVLKEQYLVGRVLGQGGFGITYLAWDLYLDTPVAIKEYYPKEVVMRECSVSNSVSICTTDGETRFRNSRERFLREAKMLARFSQTPEIVQVRNFFLANNTAYIVMEYVEGITLKQYVTDQGGKLSMEETMSILRPILRALAMVHKAGLIHRDISPDNIMLLPGGGAKLLDFGAVRDMVNNNSSMTEAILKRGFAPIEQYQQRGNLGPWSDVYAMSATIYYCITGEVLLGSPDRLVEYDRLDLEEKAPQLPDYQRRALEHGLELLVKDRTPSVEVLCRELFPEDVPTPEPPKPAPKGKKKPGKKPVKKEAPKKKPEKKAPALKIAGWEVPAQLRRWLLPGAAAVLAVAAIGIAAALLAGKAQPAPGPEPEPTSFWPTLAPTEEAIPAGDEIVSGQCGEGMTWTLNRTTQTLTIEGEGKMQNYAAWWNAPYADYAPWNDYRDEIIAVVIGEGITEVGERAFDTFENLQSVQLPSSLRGVNQQAFYRCNLHSVQLPEGLRYIAPFAFAGNALTELTLPDSLRYVYRGAFQGMESLQSVTVGPATRLNLCSTEPIFTGTNVTIHGYTNSAAEDYARTYGHEFQSVGTLEWTSEGQCGDDVYYQLNRDTGLLRINGTGAMWDFNGTWMEGENAADWVEGRELPPWSQELESICTVTIGDGVTSVGENAFESCPWLWDVSFGNTVERIGFLAFRHAGFEVLALPDNITEIDALAFANCPNLRVVELPAQLPELWRDVINDCENLQELWIGRDTAITGLDEGEFLTNSGMSFPGLTIVGLRGSDAERVAEEKGISFAVGTPGCMSEPLGRWAEDEGQCGPDVWWFKGGDTLTLYGTGETYVYRIDDEARRTWASNWSQELLQYGDPDFYQYRDEITRIVIMPGVEQLNLWLFCDMSALNYVDFGTVRSMHLPFLNCSALESVHLPQSLAGISVKAFNYCESLRSITVEGGSDNIEAGAFGNCPALEEVIFYGNEHIEAGADLLASDSDESRSDHVTFYVKEGSDALRCVQEYNIPYEILE